MLTNLFKVRFNRTFIFELNCVSSSNHLSFIPHIENHCLAYALNLLDREYKAYLISTIILNSIKCTQKIFDPKKKSN